MTGQFSVINWVDNVNHSGDGLTLEMLAFKLFTVANSRNQFSWSYHVTLLYSPTGAAPQFL